MPYALRELVRKSVTRFRKAFPRVRTYSPWNEVNHASQPTARRPDVAVRYYRVVRANCRGCRIVAADVLDSRGVHDYLREFTRRAPGAPRLWGLHNYGDVNRKTDSQTRSVLDLVPGEVWLTETGGIVHFGKSFPYSEARAANRTSYLLELANRYTRKRKGLRSRVTRMYIYQWHGAPRGTRFDSGLTDPNGKARRAYYVVRKKARGKT